MTRQATDGHDKPLTQGEREIAEYHLAGLTVREIQGKVNITFSAVAKILRRPHVAAFVREVQDDAAEATRRRLVALANRAVAVLGDVMEDGEGSPAAARVAAAKEVLARVVPPRTAIEGGATPVQVSIARDVSTLSDDELRRLAGVTDDATG